MAKPAGTHVDDYFRDEAAAGNAGFAIAYAINRLAAAHERAASALDRLGFDTERATGEHSSTGIGEALVLEFRRISGALEQIAATPDSSDA